MPPLGIISGRELVSLFSANACFTASLQCSRYRPRSMGSEPVGGSVGDSYLMVLPVRRRIHWGIGRFCFCAFASFCLVRKVLWLWLWEHDCQLSMSTIISRPQSPFSLPANRRRGRHGTPEIALLRLCFVRIEIQDLRTRIKTKSFTHTGMLTVVVGMRAILLTLSLGVVQIERDFSRNSVWACGKEALS